MSIAKHSSALDSASPSSTIITTSISSAATPALTANANNPDAPPNINPIIADTNDADSVSTCPQRDITFAEHIGLVGHLRVHRTEAGEPVSEAPKFTRRIRPSCPHCTRTFTHKNLQ
ncbi:hypothetical protein SprV_0100110600 [Sparganum proliferum]